MSERRVDQVTRRHTVAQSLLNKAKLAFIGKTTPVDLAALREQERVVSSACDGSDREGQVELGRARDERNLEALVEEVDAVSFFKHILRLPLSVIQHLS